MKQIELTRGFVAIVDDVDYKFISQFKWCVAQKKNAGPLYACRRVSGKNILMHHVVIGRMGFILKPGQTVDHRNRSVLDNRRGNLRVASYSQNCANVPKKKKNATSKYKGVFYNPVNKNWRARIRQNYKFIEVGSFDTEDQAAIAYNQKALQLFGEFAFLNNIS